MKLTKAGGVIGIAARWLVGCLAAGEVLAFANAASWSVVHPDPPSTARTGIAVGAVLYAAVMLWVLVAQGGSRKLSR